VRELTGDSHLTK
jgi:pre-mRNA-splicing helicase BRR2